VARRRLSRLALEERGSSLVEGLMALGLVLLAFLVGAELLVFVQARTLAIAAAQEGARAAALGGEGAGLVRARQVLAAGGRLAGGLAVSIVEQGGLLTATVAGSPPSLFALPLGLPALRSSATVVLERYPASEQAVSP
jgi:hypothetical protein